MALVACGGKIAGELPGSSGDDAGQSANLPGPSTDDSGVTTTTPSDPSNPGDPSQTGDPFPVCPALAPQPGASCASHDLGCVYVDYQKKTCISFTCTSKGIWADSTPAGC